MSTVWTPGSASRMPEPTPETTPETAEVFARVAASRGWVSNLLKSLGHAPEALARFSALGHYGRYGNALSERQRELVIVIVGRGIAYAWAHHAPLARDAGVTEAELAAIQDGRTPDGLSPADKALCDFVFAFTSFAGIPDPVWTALTAAFSPREATDIAMLAAYYLAAGSLIIGLGVKVESPEVLAIERAWQQQPRIGDQVVAKTG
ncbi:carboxymuconolactone decarboxylase family protein [Elioraea tepidiphila]|jgi:alkylhydroperoxidase family enzyme|uniref:carboxymuconolactone decarboxylase family protein n=1 Tax=Elioraea tepidiphila TaxID=457934 RepID=UPI002FDB4E29